MKQFQSLVSAALAVTIVFTACSGGHLIKKLQQRLKLLQPLLPRQMQLMQTSKRLDENKKLVSDFYSVIIWG
jgi:hypothetical protein